MKSVFAALFVAGVGIGFTLASNLPGYESRFIAWLGGLNLGALAGAGLLVSRRV
ncbi:MAG: hypothetical protein HOW73_20345 [Polyangiaceae bacterium]|nr:hypothetical protein [Polyangiaceae bacterium]